jgi:pilus assembly protein Flp/PilA
LSLWVDGRSALNGLNGEDEEIQGPGRRKMNLIQLAHATLMKLARDTRGQDLIEYALMAGFVAVAAGAFMPNVADSISTIFSAVSSALTVAGSQS